MDRPRVAAHAPDPITHAGVTSWLRSCSDLHVLGEREESDVAVLVVVADFVTADLLTALARTGDVETRKIVLIARQLSERDLATAIATGVVAVLPRVGARAELLVHAVLHAVREPPRAPAQLAAVLRAHLERVNRDDGGPGRCLTQREIELLRMIAAGWDTAEIATAMSYSRRTVKNMVHRLLNRLKLRNRSHAVAYAVRVGVI